MILSRSSQYRRELERDPLVKYTKGNYVTLNFVFYCMKEARWLLAIGITLLTLFNMCYIKNVKKFKHTFDGLLGRSINSRIFYVPVNFDKAIWLL